MTDVVSMSLDPITRIVGSLGIHTRIDFKRREVVECRSTSSIFRGYSVFLRGKDPRDLALMAFGGGGPLHAVEVARLLGIRRVLISPVSGVFSAAGMLAAEAVHEFIRPLLAPLAEVDDTTVKKALDGIDSIAALTAAVPVIFAVLLGYFGDRMNRVHLSQVAALVWGVTAIATGLAVTGTNLVTARAWYDKFLPADAGSRVTALADSLEPVEVIARAPAQPAPITMPTAASSSSACTMA